MNDTIPDEEVHVRYDNLQELAPALLQSVLADLWGPKETTTNGGMHATASDLVNILYKFDISGAYRNIPLDPILQALQVICWEGRMYIDTRLGFGSRAGPRS